MIYIALQSEYSFQQCYYHLERLVKEAVSRGDSAVGIADTNNTFAHTKFEKLCKKYKIKPIFGVRLLASKEIKKARSLYQSMDYQLNIILLAKNDIGLIEIYKIVEKAYDRFYYAPRLLYSDIEQISENVIVIGNYIPEDGLFVSQRFDYISLDKKIKQIGNKEYIYIPNIKYSNIEDKDVYELLSYSKGTDIKTYGNHLKSKTEISADGICQDSISNTDLIASTCNAKISRADMLVYPKKMDMKTECMKGAFRLNIDLDDPIYAERLDREINLIADKGFQDYFFIVADVLMEAKKDSMVGPGRGSSGGSLVCYLMGITEVDPVKHNLLFERFVDVNRSSLPDIDTDIPDIKRKKSIKYLEKKYGKENVRSIGTISTFKPKSAIVDFAKALMVPSFETEDLKDSIIERSSGDARAALCIKDAFDETDVGQKFIEKYPEMRIVEKIEGHARHSGKHAAGIIVANKPLYNYGGINSRESIVMMDKVEAEALGLLKIDILGLRTLSILEDTAKLSGFNFRDYYKLKLDDDKVFDIFNKNRLYGIFQFEGKALGMVTKQMGVHSFHDIAAITALGRPGSLNSGGTAKYIKRRHGDEEITSYGEVYDRLTKDTYGIVIYQEQTMRILKEFGELSWEAVNILLRAISKSYGDEFFGKYKADFLKGGLSNGYSQKESEDVWTAVASMGSYGFNKAHAVSYSLISYWTAWSKAYYPLEFAAANLNHAKDKESAIKILRDFVVNDKIEYVSVDPDISGVNWQISGDKLIGGLTNIDGIGIKKAQGIIKTRKEGGKYTPSIMKKMLKPVTDFDILFPTDHYFGELYRRPEKYGIKNIIKIKDVNDTGEYLIIGKVINRDLRNRNDVQSVIRRGYRVEEEPFFLYIYLEDDTGEIKCMIPSFRMEELNGHLIAEQAIPGKTWYLMKGEVRDHWGDLSIKAIQEIKKGEYGVKENI